MDAFLKTGLVATVLLWTLSGTSAQAAAGNHVSSGIQRVHRVGKHDRYRVDVAYPLFSKYSPEVNAELNKAIRHLVNTHISPCPGSGDLYNEYSCTYEVRRLDERLVSVDFEFYEYLSGANSYSYHVPFNYRVAPAVSPINLESAFGKRVDYQRLQKLVWTRLESQTDSDVFPPLDGERVLERILSVYAIGKRTVTFTFAQSDIEPSSNGCPTAKLSVKDLGTMLSRDSILRQH